MKTFEKLGCNIPPNHIEARHRVSHRQVFTQEGLLASFGCEKGSTEKNGNVDLPGQNKLVFIL